MCLSRLESPLLCLLYHTHLLCLLPSLPLSRRERRAQPPLERALRVKRPKRTIRYESLRNTSGWNLFHRTSLAQRCYLSCSKLFSSSSRGNQCCMLQAIKPRRVKRKSRLIPAIRARGDQAGNAGSKHGWKLGIPCSIFVRSRPQLAG
ncbi:hypothetical protein BJ322DRAFT_538988 [Thelephora terrestris]|uniref:Secreted protein n=1 Tax=Thelephora terrestris TaxID=56493 RepID=A0A9P6HMD7_9AGAM|nr:hypothetical protein BJ322DRAFT_538988 [Thelephora terrestris]